MNKGTYIISKSKKYEAPNSASYASTASYINPTFISASAAASGFGSGGGGPVDTSGFVTTGSFNNFTSSVVLNTSTSSFVTNNQTSSFVTNQQTSSFVTNNQTGSFVTNTQTGSFVQNNQTSSFITNQQTSSFVLNTQTSSFVTNEQTSSFVTNTQTSSFVTNTQTGSFVTNTQTGSFVPNTATSSFAVTNIGNTFNGDTNSFNSYIKAANVLNATSFESEASIYTDGGLRVRKDAYVSGTLYTNNLTVYGTQSVQYVTSSQLNISTNLITVNTGTPTIRFGGLSVIDSGSTGKTGSILWDSQENVWIYTNPSGSNYDGGMFLVGPRTATMGTDVGIRQGYAPVGDGSHHMTSSAIYSSESIIRLENNTWITGSLNVSLGITGSFSGSVFGYVSNEATTSFITNQQTSSFVTNTQTGSFITNEQTSSFVLNTQTGSFITNTQTGSFIQSVQTGSMYTYSSSFATTASYIDPLFISASAAASGFGSGQGGGVTSITAGDGISINQSTGNVTITNTVGGMTTGKILALATGMSNLF